jgi:chemotaxis protein MotA
MKRFQSPVISGLLIGGLAIGAAVALEGIKLTFLWQPTAALVVFGGTLGAVTVRCGLGGLWQLLRQMISAFKVEDTHDEELTIARFAWMVRNAKLEGPRVFEQYANASQDRLTARGLSLAAEYAPPDLVRRALDIILDDEDRDGRRQVNLLESAGGYAPTFGILGAVLGLIHVLRSIDNPGALGLGIATAFVATVYGVALANLLFFPLASRLREQHDARMRRREMLASALVAISANESPTSITRLFNPNQKVASAAAALRELSNQ